jgi:tRNA threonylcarbamoyladenosine biosynthesis protein TsaE
MTIVGRLRGAHRDGMAISELTLTLSDATATDALGAALARAFRGTGAAGTGAAGTGAAGTAAVGTAPTVAVPATGGAVLYLYGELGTGKTTCARSLLRSLGVTGVVRSPTFTLIEAYPIRDLNCVHVDLYRLSGAAEVDELGLRDFLNPRYLLLIEWPERGGNALPAADLELTLHYAPSGRLATLCARTDFGAAWSMNLQCDTSIASYVSNLT